jgi:hypothetical protein
MTPYMREQLALEYASRATKVSLHTGAPGTTGANELALTRQDLTWNAGGADGEIVSDEVTFTLAAPADLTNVGIWDSGGNFLDSFTNNIHLEAGDYSFTLRYIQN